MSEAIAEADWKVFRELRVVALERFCERALAEVERLAADPDKSAHQRYLAVYKAIERRDRELADAFDSPSRSAALRNLVGLHAQKLLTDEEFSRFSPELRDRVRTIFEIWRR
jgi:hypothetical protein